MTQRSTEAVGRLVKRRRNRVSTGASAAHRPAAADHLAGQGVRAERVGAARPAQVAAAPVGGLDDQPVLLDPAERSVVGVNRLHRPPQQPLDDLLGGEAVGKVGGEVDPLTEGARRAGSAAVDGAGGPAPGTAGEVADGRDQARLAHCS